MRARAPTPCATYLSNKRPYLDYLTALQQGWPITTGVIEGACRHRVKDRMDLSGARWGLDGVECFRPNVSGPDAERLQRLARENGLFVTGGSDWHGPRKNFALGEFNLRADQVEEILAVGGLGAG